MTDEVLVIRCTNCSGPVWEEDHLDSDMHIDLVCIICGKRDFYNKQKYLKFKKRISEEVKNGKTATSKWRALS